MCDNIYFLISMLQWFLSRDISSIHSKDISTYIARVQRNNGHSVNGMTWVKAVNGNICRNIFRVDGANIST
jgi:hypothetical protein